MASISFTMYFRFAEQSGEDIVVRMRLPRLTYPYEVCVDVIVLTSFEICQKIMGK